MSCTKCHRSDCDVLARFEDYRRDRFAFIPLQNAMLACGVAASYRRLGVDTPQPVTTSMLQEIAVKHELRR
jgi:hypothetical protein